MKTYKNINIINENIITMLSNLIIEGRNEIRNTKTRTFQLIQWMFIASFAITAFLLKPNQEELCSDIFEYIRNHPSVIYIPLIVDSIIIIFSIIYFYVMLLDLRLIRSNMEYHENLLNDYVMKDGDISKLIKYGINLDFINDKEVNDRIKKNIKHSFLFCFIKYFRFTLFCKKANSEQENKLVDMIYSKIAPFYDKHRVYDYGFKAFCYIFIIFLFLKISTEFIIYFLI